MRIFVGIPSGRERQVQYTLPKFEQERHVLRRHCVTEGD